MPVEISIKSRAIAEQAVDEILTIMRLNFINERIFTHNAAHVARTIIAQHIERATGIQEELADEDKPGAIVKRPIPNMEGAFGWYVNMADGLRYCFLCRAYTDSYETDRLNASRKLEGMEGAPR